MFIMQVNSGHKNLTMMQLPHVAECALRVAHPPAMGSTEWQLLHKRGLQFSNYGNREVGVAYSAPQGVPTST